MDDPWTRWDPVVGVVYDILKYLGSLFCFVLWHINLIGHLMPNQVKESKSEKKFNGEVLGIHDKL